MMRSVLRFPFVFFLFLFLFPAHAAMAADTSGANTAWMLTATALVLFAFYAALRLLRLILTPASEGDV